MQVALFQKFKYMYSMIGIRILCKENYDRFVTKNPKNCWMF